MRPYKPGPRSRTQAAKSYLSSTAGNLGDETANTSSGSDTSDEFQSPELIGDATDYGLDYTSEETRKRVSATQRNIESSPPRRHASNEMQRRSGKQNTRPQAQNTAAPTSRRKQSKPIKKLLEYKKLIENVNFMVPRTSFGRLVRQILLNIGTEVNRMTSDSLEALQTATEAYVTQRLEDAYLLTLHRGRVTLSLQDLLLIKYLRRFNH